MALPTNRSDFLEYCLRKLGKGAIDINVTSEQSQDRIDEALEHFQEYHDEGTERILLSYQITQNDKDNKYISLPNNIIGVTGYLPNKSGAASIFFDVEYQYMLSNVHEIANAEMQYFYVAMRHLENIDQMFDFLTPIRYNRVTNNVYLDENWDTFTVGDYIVFEAYRIVDETTYSNIWKNKWFRDYTTALIKKQWGENLAKYDGVQMIGGTTFNAQRLIDEANQELEQLETQVKETETAPMGIFIG